MCCHRCVLHRVIRTANRSLLDGFSVALQVIARLEELLNGPENTLSGIKKALEFEFGTIFAISPGVTVVRSQDKQCCQNHLGDRVDGGNTWLRENAD